jgi:hypothetical protein
MLLIASPPSFKPATRELRMMRYELRDYEWSVVSPMLPNKPRGIPRVEDRRILNGIFWVFYGGCELALVCITKVATNDAGHTQR